MNTRQKIYIDEVIVKPFVLCLNLLVRLAGKLLRIDHDLEKNFKTIAVAKYKGMGSIIQATPLLQTLRLKYPNARIVFITTKENVELLKKISIIDKIVYLDDQNFFSLLKTFFPFLFRLIKLKIDLYLDLEIYSNFSSLITTMSLAKNRLGYYLRSSNYRLGVYTHMMYYNIRVPISQIYLQFSRLLHCQNVVEKLYSLEGTSHCIPINEQKLDLKKEKYILINPNASDLRLERRWDAKNYITLIGLLQTQYPNLKIFLTGGKNETAYVNELHASLINRNNVVNLAGKTTIDQLISLIKYSSVFITNDTGPMHIGYSMGVKMVVLFGPCSPEQYGGSNNCFPIYHKVYCSPCVHEFSIPPCQGDNICMKLIQVNEVFNGADTILNSFDIHPTITKSGNVYEVVNSQGKKIPLGTIKRNNI